MTVCAVQVWPPPGDALLVADALGLALFAMSGAQVAEAAQCPAIIVVLMGIGMALFEETTYDPQNGAPINSSMADYIVAVNADAPPIDVYFLDYPDKEINELGARGIGEIGLAGIAAAITDAVHRRARYELGLQLSHQRDDARPQLLRQRHLPRGERQVEPHRPLDLGNIGAMMDIARMLKVGVRLGRLDNVDGCPKTRPRPSGSPRRPTKSWPTTFAPGHSSKLCVAVC